MKELKMNKILANFASFYILVNVTKTCLALPTIDPGVFVIQGVPTCRDGLGYCLLGTNCTMDRDFEADDQGGHCSEVTKSFTSILSFVCCKFVKEEEEEVYRTTISPVTLMEEKFQLLDENPIPVEDSYDSEISEDEDIENLVDIIGIVTDSTGIISLVTRPYQPPEKSSTPSSISSVISSSMMSSASTSSNETSSDSTSHENVDLNVTSTTPLNDMRPKLNIELSSSVTSEEPEPVPEEPFESQFPLSGKTTSSSTTENVDNVKVITAEPETSSYILSTSEVSTVEDGEMLSEKPMEPKPSSTGATTSNSTTNFTSSDTGAKNQSIIEYSNEEVLSNMTITVSTPVELKNATNIAEENSDSENTENTSSQDSFDPHNVINKISQMLTDNSSTTESQQPDLEDSNKNTSTTTTATTATSTQTITDNGEENKPTVPSEVPVNNKIEVLNLPEEIKNYLEKKQAEKDKRKEEVTIPTTQTKPSTYPMMSTTITVDTDDSFDNSSSTTSLPYTEMILKRVNLPNLKGTSYVPLVWTRTKTETTTQAQEQTMKYSSEGFMPSTYRTTMLQKFDGLNAIQIHEEKEEENSDKESPHPINLNICGLRTPSVMVKAILSEYARAASTYDWCWSAAVMRKEPGNDRFECSGTLIELDLVVTTAACLKRLSRNDLSSYRVVLGDSNLRDEMPYGVQYIDIAEIVAHPDYLTSGGAHSNDIGVVRLREVATIDHNVCLACISQRNAHIPSHTCVVSGYTSGSLQHYSRRDVEGFDPIDGILRESLVKLQKPSDCRASVEKLSPNPLLVSDPDSFLCDEKRKSARACINALDGGSPLVCEVGGRWFLTGIASWSRDCSTDPNIYTKVNSFSDWFLNTRLRMYGFIIHRLL